MKTEEIWKIKTPYGVKNWAFVKKCLDNHESLLEACKEALTERIKGFTDPAKDSLCLLLQQAIKQAEEL